MEISDHITLSQASKLTPGRPSTNCLWRWCRKGVLSRGGTRIRLQHVRIGGKIFTTAAWVAAFGEALAEADAAYFDLVDQQIERQPSPRTRQKQGAIQRREAAHKQAVDELEEAGL